MKHTEALQYYTSGFNDFLGQQNDSKDWLLDARKTALQKFRALGFPSRKNEDWRYTNISKLLTLEPKRTKSFLTNPKTLSPQTLKTIEAFPACLVFVDGTFCEELSKTPKQDGVTISSLQDELKAQPCRIKHLIAETASEDAFANLNLAFIEQGVFIKIAGETEMAEPLNLVHITSGQSGTPVFSPVRNIIALGSFSKASISEIFMSDSSDLVYFSNPQTDITLADGAKLDYTLIQNESKHSYHIGRTNVTLERDACLNSFSAQFGGALARHTLKTALAAEGAQATLNGLYFGSGDQVIDNHTSLDHQKPHTTSKQLYKGILTDHAHGIFNGKVFVRANAQKSDSSQLNKNLLLSKTAHIDTKPELEIAAHDVKCTHGATSGQINTDELFYLESRCLDPDLAKTLLIKGFADDVVSEIGNQTVRQLVDSLLDQAFAKIVPPEAK